MADQNLVNEKKTLLDEVKVIQDNAKAEIKAIQEREEIVRANSEIKTIESKAQEELKPKSERLLEINNSLIAEIDKEAGITYE
tara:strand:- start:92 stop:340 length:249 start_codon:yes stop_codon:yes gene_type:complete